MFGGSAVKMRVSVDLAGLKKFSSLVRDTDGPIHRVVIQWAVRYRAFLQERFIKNSQGGGSWPPLKYRKGSILWNTGTLLAALNPVMTSAPGAIQSKSGYGLVVGYGGPHKHPSGGATIADIASFHQVGAGNLPVREIIVPPSQQVINEMIKDGERGLKKMAKDSGLGK